MNRRIGREYTTIVIDKSINQETDFFVTELIRIQDDYVERQQKHLKDTGIIKRRRKLNFNNYVDNNSLTTHISISNRSGLKQSLVDIIDIECQSVIAWARQIPDFEKLSIENQTFLIEQNFLEVILFDYIWKTSQKQDTPSENLHVYWFVLNEFFMLNRQTCGEMGILDTFEHLTSIAVQLKMFGITYNEYVALKVLSLFKTSSCVSFDNSCGGIVRMREKCFMTLRKSTEESRFAKLQSFRYDSFLILMSDIKTLSMRFMSSVLSFSKDNTIEMPNLLSDMCKCAYFGFN